MALTVLSLDTGYRYKEGNIQCELRCHCGRVWRTRRTYINRIKSCGCSRDKTKEDAEAKAIACSYTTYKYGARKRNIEFLLTKEEFKNLVLGDCRYCGSPPIAYFRKRYDALLNGVDRVDSDLGYDRFNCVSCCAMCNKMKMCYSSSEFIKHCTKVASYGKCIFDPNLLADQTGN